MAIRFDAAADYIYRTANLPTGTAFTAAFWLYVTTDQNAVNTLSILTDGVNFIWAGLNTDGTTLRLETSTPATGNGTSLATATWYHVAIVKSAATYTLYLNGVSDISFGSVLSFTPLYLLLASNGVTYLNGRLASIKVWSAALSPAEIQQEMLSIIPRRTDSLNGWYPTFPGSGERTLDYSGSGNSWTEAGTLVDEDQPPVSWGAQPCWIPVITAAASGDITANLTATSLIRGALAGRGALVGGAISTAFIRAALTGRGTLAGGSTATGLLTGALTGIGTLTGGAIATTTLTASLTGDGAMTASVIAAGLLTATISALGAGDIEGTCAATSLLTGTLTGWGALASAATATSLVRGTLTGKGTLTGGAVATSLVRGTLTGIGALGARNVATSALQGALGGQGALAANAIATSALQGLLNGWGALDARLVALSDCAGTLTGTGGAVEISARLVATSTLVGNLADMTAIITVVALTLHTRSSALTVITRQFDLALSDRDNAFTLPDLGIDE